MPPGIIVELTVRVFPLPKFRVGGLAAFPCAKDACQAVVALRNAGLGTIARIELCNATMIDATNKARPESEGEGGGGRV